MSTVRSLRKGRRQVEFVLWDREQLIQTIVNSPEIGLSGWVDGSLLGAVAHADDGTLLDSDLERLSRGWVNAQFHRATLSAAVVAQRLRENNRIDLARLAAFGLVRTTAASEHNSNEPDLSKLDTARRLFQIYAEALWTQCDERFLDSEYLFRIALEPAPIVTYRVRAVRLTELLALYALSIQSEHAPCVNLDLDKSEWMLAGCPSGSAMKVRAENPPRNETLDGE